MDDDTKKIIADGNVSHDIRRTYEFPTEWKDRKPSVVSALREKDAAVKEVKAAKPMRQKTKNPEITKDRKLFWDKSYWQALCKRCHGVNSQNNSEWLPVLDAVRMSSSIHRVLR